MSAKPRPTLRADGLGPTWLRPVLAALSIAVLLLGIHHGLAQASVAARHALSVAAFAMVVWAVLRWDDTRVALLAGLALVGLQVVTPQALFASLGDSIIWLLLGSFVLSAVLRSSGVAERVVQAALRGCTRFDQLCWRLCWVIAATAWVIPSTSARAALLLPVFMVLVQTATARQARALALLFPSIILLSAGGALLGAGAHLVTADFVRTHGGEGWHWLSWTLMSAPFALGSCAMGTALIVRLFVSAPERQAHLTPPSHAAATAAWTPAQGRIAAIALLAVVGWALGPYVGLDAAVVAVLAALLVTTPQITGCKLAAVLKQVEWHLLLFLSATLVLGQALLDTGAASTLAQQLMAQLHLQSASPALLLTVAACIALAAHLVVPSRMARAVVLLPTVVLPLAATGLDVALLAMLVVQGTGFCQTLSVSAKPVAVFAQSNTGSADEAGPAFAPEDLLRLAAALAPCMLAWLLLHALWLWPAMGLGG